MEGPLSAVLRRTLHFQIIHLSIFRDLQDWHAFATLHLKRCSYFCHTSIFSQTFGEISGGCSGFQKNVLFQKAKCVIFLFNFDACFPDSPFSFFLDSFRCQYVGILRIVSNCYIQHFQKIGRTMKIIICNFCQKFMKFS